MSGKAKAAARYTPEFCGAIVDGIALCLEYMSQVAIGGTFLVEDGLLFEIGPDMCDESDLIPFAFNEWGHCVDDILGGDLPMDLVREARRTEMEGFGARKVYEIRPRYECERAGGKIIGVRWVDTAKNGGVRSRLVCPGF